MATIESTTYITDPSEYNLHEIFLQDSRGVFSMPEYDPPIELTISEKPKILAPAEVQIVQCILDGVTADKLISIALAKKRQTVKNEIQTLFEKIGGYQLENGTILPRPQSKQDMLLDLILIGDIEQKQPMQPYKD